MRTLRFLPFCYLCGIHGFTFFAPYLAVVLTVVHLIKRRQASVVAAAIPIDDEDIVIA